MEETHDDTGQTGQGPSSSTWWASDFVEGFGSVSLTSQEDRLSRKEASRHNEQDELYSETASQILWSTGVLSEPIPNGFYSVVPDKKLKEMFDRLPTLDELSALETDGLRADIILVDVQRDKKLHMLKQLITALVKGLNSNPAATIKKIAGLVSDLYKRPNMESSPVKSLLEEASQGSMSRGVQLLGQIKHGSCRPRAILFKVLADTVGLESKLMVGLPNDERIECADSSKHMSVVVVLNSVELLVDLMRFPGQLIPRSTRAIFLTHISAAGESDSAENDSCDSPLEPNSPMCGFSERVDQDSAEKDDTGQFARRFDMNVPGPSLQNRVLRTATLERRLSPEHPSLRARGRSMLGGERKSFRDFADDAGSSRSVGVPTSEARRLRRRSISITPEIGDDIVRAVRAMNETLKQNRLLRERGEDRSLPTSPSSTIGANTETNASDFRLGNRDEISGARSALYALHGEQSSQKAVSLPSSPHQYRTRTLENMTSGQAPSDEMVSTWNSILEARMYRDKSLLPYDEWNIDFTELTVGTRVGIGFFGEVFRGIWNGTDVAIKVFLEQDLTSENMEDFCNEIAILSRLRHPNVILFLGACTKPPRLSMVTEYMEMGSLYYLIHLSGQKKKLTWRKRLKMLRDICRGLMCIHRTKIVHRDLKSANCLVNKHWTVKICDFGLSRIVTDSPNGDSSSAGTPEWMAPELIRNEPFTEKCDIFSLGVIMWELCTLSRPWEGVPPERVVYTVANEGSRLEIPEGPLGRLIADCWAEPHERPNCKEILSRLLDCEYALC
ncbi:serine/threonine-protein kinase EDR1 isoform X3 [Spinacia oleracea]|uniref:Serine/threonine-protein kinase EDR1 isoform X3 n=1 Tax=Spinacia oleracea TaxID=3562 RepID=A0ABM3RUN1_SPIOL|nr:serine/threonine-protein kinase EDR1-like isoform X3 [Spinacia oleracea]XP_056699322.1 serine/threonine-protein kinase EDR1-like isoform X3 [Spinacia oleracea]